MLRAGAAEGSASLSIFIRSPHQAMTFVHRWVLSPARNFRARPFLPQARHRANGGHVAEIHYKRRNNSIDRCRCHLRFECTGLEREVSGSLSAVNQGAEERYGESRVDRRLWI